MKESVRMEKIYAFIIHDPIASKVASSYSVSNTAETDHIPSVVNTFKNHAREHYYNEESSFHMLLPNSNSSLSWEQHWDNFCLWFDTNKQTELHYKWMKSDHFAYAWSLIQSTPKNMTSIMCLMGEHNFADEDFEKYFGITDEQKQEIKHWKESFKV